MQRKIYSLTAGNLKNLKLKNHELSKPSKGMVTVRVKAIGLNFADVFAIWGLYSATPKGEFTPGLEYAGEILEVGEGVTNVKVGDRVMGVSRFGAYADHLNIEEEYVIPIPSDWSFGEGAGYLVQVLTAYYGLKYLGNIETGDQVLVHSAAGGVGIFAGRLARQLGAKTIGTVGRHEKVDFCKKEGYEKVIVRGKNFGEQLAKSVDKPGLDIVMECIGGKVFQDGYDQLAPEGRMIVYGSARYATPGNKPNYFKLFYKFLTRPKIDPQGMIEMNRGILGFNLIYLYDRAPLLHKLLSELKEIEIGKPIVGHEFEFDQLPDAIRLFQTGKTIGKVIINV